MSGRRPPRPPARPPARASPCLDWVFPMSPPPPAARAPCAAPGRRAGIRCGARLSAGAAETRGARGRGGRGAQAGRGQGRRRPGSSERAPARRNRGPRGAPRGRRPQRTGPASPPPAGAQAGAARGAPRQDPGQGGLRGSRGLRQALCGQLAAPRSHGVPWHPHPRGTPAPCPLREGALEARARLPVELVWGGWGRGRQEARGWGRPLEGQEVGTGPLGKANCGPGQLRSQPNCWGPAGLFLPRGIQGRRGPGLARAGLHTQ